MPYNPDTAQRLRVALKKLTPVTERKMFGGVAFMVNGHMCAGVNGDDLVLRLGHEQAAAALTKPHTRPMDFTGRPLKSMVYLEPPAYRTARQLDAWLKRALAFNQTLPPK